MTKRRPDQETLILRKYKKPVLQELDALRANRKMRSVCREKLNNMNPARLTEILNESRELTFYYLGKFINGGIVSLEQILQGKKLEDLPKEDRALLRKLATKDDDIELIWEAEKHGTDWREVLKMFIKSRKD